MTTGHAHATEPPSHLPRPGLIGILIRLGLAGLIGWMAFGAIVDAPSFWDGYTEPAKSLGYLIPLTLFSSWVINELLGKKWGQRPALVLLSGLATTLVAGAIQGDVFGPAYGVYLWVWVLLFAALLGPAHLLAAVLRTPGCEMRSYAHLRSIVRGGDANESVCPGCIDRFDGVRVFGKW